MTASSDFSTSAPVVPLATRQPSTAASAGLGATPFHITFPAALPVSARREEIMAAMQAHQVIIVCGETGSGKTTQLPKIAMLMGRGKHAAAAAGKGTGKWIGHTQPRRIAASSVAKRIAEELKTPLGEVVGYKIRFQDKLSRNASVKLMTDGILLAEIQTDPLLLAYDTLIIDEAHERSLNIDFLLGYLRAVLPRRPDLKIVVTSATIDAQRFANHFANAQGPAPTIMVSGRTYPVEMRYRPFEEKRDYDTNAAIADAVDELWRDPHQSGDILIFLPGEREIKEAAEHLRKHVSHQPIWRNSKVLPLFSRLSQAEQDQIFAPHGERRIVLATNVAETSLTVPGIKYVIDVGVARIKRYSLRSKVEQLLVEPISQAAANQRAGRCGRVADGICIRLYDEKEFQGRPAFTDPEILRSSLASVILRMKALGLGAVESFPFLEPPSARAITDGYQMLAELGAVDPAHELTPLGRELARLPLDPRVGRMLLEAHKRHALAEVLVIAAALAVQDVRDRPLDAQQAADQAHAKFDDDKSEFSSYLRLWQCLLEARGEPLVVQPELAGVAQTTPKIANAVKAQKYASAAASQPSANPVRKISNRQYEQWLKQNFINVRRVREWRDVHSQLLQMVAEQKWRVNTKPASYDELHLSLLSGLLGNIGWKPESDDFYVGARGIKFHRHPGAHLRKKSGRWIVAAELMETSRLYARGVANIEPHWLEVLGAHLIKKQLVDPHWEKKAAEALVLERATLYGLLIYSGRKVLYSKVDMVGAREIFIREALVAEQWQCPFPFLSANQKMIAQVQELEHKSRRQDVLVDDALIFAFYDQQIPDDVCSGHSFESWYRRAVQVQPDLLHLTRDALMRHEAAGITSSAFPKTIRLGGVDCLATYLHEPGAPKDGVTVNVPLFVLNQVSEARGEWLVPGMLKEKIQGLLKSLPQRPRSRLVPLPDSATKLAAQLSQPEAFGSGGLTDAVLTAVRSMVAVEVKYSDFKLETLSPHLFMNFCIVDAHGRQLGIGRNLAALKAELGAQARGAFQALASLKLAKSEASEAIAPDLEAVQAKNTAHKAGAEIQKSTHQNPLNKTAAVVPGAERTHKVNAPTALAEQRYTQWTFGALPELMEIQRGAQTLIGFPALIADGDAVKIEVFDEPEVASLQHWAGLRLLFGLQIKDALKYLEKNLPDLQKMSIAYMPLGTLEMLRAQLLDVALERAFLRAPLPEDATAFKLRIDEGRGRLTLIANEIARLAAIVLQDYAAAQRKIKDSKNYPETAADALQQLQRLMSARFMADTPWEALQHFPRYLKAITVRLEKVRADPQRDLTRLKEIQLQEQRYWRLVAQRKGVTDQRMAEFRWLLEELRVSYFAQELRTPQPVSIKRLDKAWTQLQG